MQSNPTRKDRGHDRNRDPNWTRASRKEFSRGSQGRAPGVPVDLGREEQEEGGGVGDKVRVEDVGPNTKEEIREGLGAQEHTYP